MGVAILLSMSAFCFCLILEWYISRLAWLQDHNLPEAVKQHLVLSECVCCQEEVGSLVPCIVFKQAVTDRPPTVPYAGGQTACPAFCRGLGLLRWQQGENAACVSTNTIPVFLAQTNLVWSPNMDRFGLETCSAQWNPA